ncbi:hypothetical protein [Runella zeae]|uniref:hypothetical protein n=1 Tax=Runella zeae TaxID=94255 RepID=UPI002353ADD3|nr:hypothetical protein [Runella zeae]
MEKSLYDNLRDFFFAVQEAKFGIYEEKIVQFNGYYLKDYLQSLRAFKKEIQTQMSDYIQDYSITKTKKLLFLTNCIRLVSSIKNSFIRSDYDDNFTHESSTFEEVVGTNINTADINTYESKLLIKIQYEELLYIESILLDSKNIAETLPTDLPNPKKLRFTIQKNQLAMLFLGLRESGIISKSVTNYQLAQFLEQCTTHSNNNEVKNVEQLFSQIISDSTPVEAAFESLKKLVKEIKLPNKA